MDEIVITVSGVNGCGKTLLIQNVLVPALKHAGLIVDDELGDGFSHCLALTGNSKSIVQTILDLGKVGDVN